MGVWWVGEWRLGGWVKCCWWGEGKRRSASHFYIYKLPIDRFSGCYVNDNDDADDDADDDDDQTFVHSTCSTVTCHSNEREGGERWGTEGMVR